MAIGIDPKVDFAFKLTFGHPKHPRITMHFLNSILSDQPKITQVEILNPILGKEIEDDKISVLDILATDEYGRLLNIEMQTTLPKGLPKRLLYYTSRRYAAQLTEGTRYSDLHPAISICVLTNALFPNRPDLHLDFRLRQPTGEILTDDLQIHLLQLSKLRLTADNVYAASPIERWAFFLQNAEMLAATDVERLFPDQEIAEAAGVLEMISQTPDERRLYDARLKFQRDQTAILEGAVDEARAQALREGELRGQIKLLQQMLNMPQSTSDELSNYSNLQLIEMRDQLQIQLRERH